MDFILADRTVLPPDQQVHYTEKICYLPGCYQPNGRFQDVLKALPDRAFQRATLGLPEHGVVFCCFNATYKITPEVFSAWMRVLHRVDGSVLWLLDGAATTSSHLRASANLIGTT